MFNMGIPRKTVHVHYLQTQMKWSEVKSILKQQSCKALGKDFFHLESVDI